MNIPFRQCEVAASANVCRIRVSIILHEYGREHAVVLVHCFVHISTAMINPDEGYSM